MPFTGYWPAKILPSIIWNHHTITQLVITITITDSISRYNMYCQQQYNITTTTTNNNNTIISIFV